MPSEKAFTTALEALAPERAAFRSALAATLEQVRGMMVAGHNGESGQDRCGHELGAFAAGRIRFDRYAEVAHTDTRYRKSVLPSIRHAQQLLTATLSLGDQLHCIDVEENGDLPAAVNEALSTAGRAFAAAYAIEVIRAGHEEHRSDQTLLAPLSPDRWTRSERLIAPPLLVRVHGKDLRLSGFEDLLQGNQKIILIVQGVAPPAALVRLISPSVFVMQCRTPEELSVMHEVPGPAIAAVLDEPAATFRFQSGLLSVQYVPTELPKRALKASTVFRQREDLGWLKQLEELQRARAADVAKEEASEVQQPGDKLAAWLLKQIELPAS